MPREVVWTKAALDDLDEILQEVEQDDPQYPRNELEDRAFQIAELLSGQPHLGGKLDTLSRRPFTYRHIVIHPNYRLIYTIQEPRVYVVAFLQTRRDLKRAWSSRRRSTP